MSVKGRCEPNAQHTPDMRRDLLLRLAPSDTSLHRVITEIARKHVLIEELHFEIGAHTYQVQMVLRAAPAHLDHVTAVLDNNIAVLDIIIRPSIAHPSGT